MVIVVRSKRTPSQRQVIAAQWKRIATLSDLIRAKVFRTHSQLQRIASRRSRKYAMSV
jgi:hypothetical protein